MALNLSQTQKASQVQTQKLSQQQIQSLKILAKSSLELREDIYEWADDNPALEISDSLENNLYDAPEKKQDYDEDGNPDYDGNLDKYTSSRNSGNERSDAFQNMLENETDDRETLREHLLRQLCFLKLDEKEEKLCRKLIGNLDDKGFHILAPISLLNRKTGENEPLLKKCLGLLQVLDPVGTCVKDFSESLFVQAKTKLKSDDELSKAILFLLDGKLEFLDPPTSGRILKKIEDYVKEEKKLAFNDKDYSFLEKLTEADVEAILSFIKTLNPKPAGNFSGTDAAPVKPDVFVNRIFLENIEADEKKFQLQVDQSSILQLTVSDSVLPELRISKDFVEMKDAVSSEKQKKEFEELLAKARISIQCLEFRKKTLAEASFAIMKAQKDFFLKGQGNLLPLNQKNIADEIGVHESTISRMAKSKYLWSRWGIFPISFFFTNEAAASENNDEGASDVNPVSKERVLFLLKGILDEHKDDLKPLSDQKLSDLLSEKGVSVARRTVAKYRKQLNIDSSYTRK